MNFLSRLREIQADRSTVICIGLDPDPERLPPHLLERFSLPDAVVAFNRLIIEATRDYTCAFKFNLAFYEVLAEDSWRVLEESLAFVPQNVITIADGKRGDIANSARFYADALFSKLEFDACTVSGYMGRDSVEPFLEYADHGVFVLVRTSNPGAADFQELQIGEERLFEIVARKASTWNENQPATLGFVVGGTEPSAIRAVRKICPDAPLLIPGIGTQGGDAEAVMGAASGGPVIVNSSRQIIYASNGQEFAAAAALEARQLRDRLQTAGA
jgi:orotidine-5'-phosphate decarboxylase